MFDKFCDFIIEDEEEKCWKKDVIIIGFDLFVVVDSVFVEKDSNNKFILVGFFNWVGWNSKMMIWKSFVFFKSGDKDKEKDKNNVDKVDRSDRSDKMESRVSIVVGELLSNGGYDVVLFFVLVLFYLNGVRSNGIVG